MALKKTRKLVHETMVEEPTKNFDVQSETIREESQEDHDNRHDHENEEEQLATILLFQNNWRFYFK
jgi:hypothetical protein